MESGYSIEARDTAPAMSTENVELARRIHGAWNDRDLETMRALADPEVEYVNSPTAVEPGTRHGHDGAYDRASDAVGDADRCQAGD